MKPIETEFDRLFKLYGTPVKPPNSQLWKSKLFPKHNTCSAGNVSYRKAPKDKSNVPASHGRKLISKRK